MTAKTRMQRRIMGTRRRRDVYKYVIPTQDPENTSGWSTTEKLLFIVLRKRANELGTCTFELSESEVAALMDAEITILAAGLSSGIRA